MMGFLRSNSVLKNVSMVASLLTAWFLIAGAPAAAAQACPAQNWAATTPNVWVADGSIKVMLNNNASTNQPVIPTYEFDGNFNPFGFEEHPEAITVLNDVWSCPSGTPMITMAGAGRETVSFQLFLSASASAALSHVSVTVSPLTGAGTLTSDNTGSSNVTRYLEGYVPYSGLNPNSPTQLQANGQMPDPLIPFYDPFDSGNPAVATPFNVQAGTTQGVWVNLSIPPNQTAGSYSGTVTISGTGIATTTIPISLTVWNGTLPPFDEGSVSSTYADMLKSWLPFYRGNFDSGEGMTCGGPGCSTELALYEKYQVMGHNYFMDVQMDGDQPTINGCYPSSGGCTTFTSDGTTSSIDWTAYDAYEGPALTPGALFTDGTAMRVFDTPLSTQGSGGWPGGTGKYGYSWYDNESDGYSGSLVPSGLTQLFGNLATQTSQHFAANHASKGWAIPELIVYDYDETDNDGKGQVGYDPQIYQNISLFNAAINNSNSALSSTWAASTAPIHTFLTDMPACPEFGDYPWYTNSVCADHINLSYPGGTNATPGYSKSWDVVWSPNPVIFMPGRPGPAFHSDVNPTLVDGTGYQYTLDFTDGVPALSTAPVPIERWFYQGGDPASAGDAISNTGVGWRINYWIAYKYGLDETIASMGDANPAAPAPGGVWDWVGDFWGGYGGASSPSNCSNSNAPSPFVSAATTGDGVLFYPGNEVGCYYTANPVGEAALTASPAVNTTCASNGYGVCNGISGPVASMRLETVRRGYEDYEYMYLLGKKSGRSAPLAIINAMGGAGITQGGQGTTSWNALDWENVTGGWYEMGVEPESSAYSGYCTDSTPGLGGLPNGLPNGPTGAASTGSNFNYVACPGEWTNNPYRFEQARLEMAQQLGFAPASTTPSITSLSPSSGINSGGTSVTITGTNFTGVDEVQFGGVEATSFTVNSSTTITAVTPGGSGGVDVQVFSPNGVSQYSSADIYTYVSPVTVTGLSPSQGPAAGGTSVTITGTYFSSGATVMFGNTAATSVVVNSSTKITATAPAGTSVVNVIVTTYQGTSATSSADLYTYEAAPTVTSVSPSSGTVAGGTSVTIGGTGFVSGMIVDFGNTPGSNVVVSSSTSATVTSPSNSSPDGGLVNITVTTSNGTSAVSGADHYTYTSPVTVTGLSVHTGPPAGGTTVVITGTGFTGATAVKFGSDTASFTVNSSTQITATSAAGGGTVDVTVDTSSYDSAPTSADQFTYTSAVANGVFATLPTTAVGSSSAATTVSITLQAATAISSITTPTAQNGVQEFVVGTVTGCTLGGTVNAAGTVCHVPVTFKPQYPGIRSAPLSLNNNSDVVGIAGVAAIGQGPEVGVSPGSLFMAIGGGGNGVTATPESVTTAAISVSNNGSGLAMDGEGNLYIADDINCLAYKVNPQTNQIVVVAGNYTFQSGAPAPSTTPTPALGSATCPQGIAVDGAGNLYIVDAGITSNGNPNVVEMVSATTGDIQIVAGGGSTVPTTTAEPALNASLNAVNSLATDSSGNVYISDFYNNQVEKLTPAGQIVVVAGSGSNQPTTTAQSATSVALSGPTGMIFDDAGNMYISDQNVSLIVKVNASGQLTVVAGGGGNTPGATPQSALSVALNNPAELAVDGAGDLYIGDFSNDWVEQMNTAGQIVVVAGGGGTVPTATPEYATSAQLGLIEGIAVDGAGNLFIADGQNIGNGANMVEKVSAAGATLSYPYTNVGSTSVPQNFTLTNIGNETFTLSSVAAPTDFTRQSGGTCSTGTQNLTTGTNCTLSFAFEPTTGGVLNESATLTDNNLNVSSAHQSLNFTGTGIGGTTVATPTFSPAGGPYVSSQTVSISTTTSGATIYYTTNGTTPTTSSTVYSTPITVSSSETVEAIAAKTGDTNSAVASAVYTIGATVATPTFSPVAGSYGPAQTVTINTTTSGATIYYTTNGSTPTTSSTQYTGAITVSSSETIKALAVLAGYNNSAVGSAAYTINGAVATPTFSPVAGTYTSAQTVTISTATSGATIYYTTNGTTPTTASTEYSSAITVSATETVKAIAVKTGYTNSAIGSATYTINSSAVATPTFSPAAGSYGPAQTVTISTTTSGATIYYTTNGTTPTTSSTKYTSPITVSTTETVKAIGVESGYANSAVASAAYTINGAAATPTFSPAGGTYSSAQVVVIASATSGTTIYYTTNGTTPTTSSTKYTAAISVATSETVKAIAVKAGYTNSAVGSAAYTINLATISTLAGVQGGTTAPTSGMVAHGHSIGAPVGVAVAPKINGSGGDIYFDTCSTAWNCSYNYSLYVIYEGGGAAKAILAAGGITSPVVGDVYPVSSLNETGPASLSGLFVDSYGNVLVADWSYNRVYMFYAGEVSGQGTNPADALLNADPAAYVVGYGLHVGYAYHIADGSNVVGAASTNPTPHDVYVDSAENVFFTDYGSNDVEVVYNTSGTSAKTILTAEGYTSLKQGYAYIIAGGQSVVTYPNDNDDGSSIAYNGATSTANTATNGPFGLCGDSSGNVYFTDSTSNKIKKLSGTTAVLSTIGGPAAGTATTVGHGGDGGLATSAQMNTPIGIVVSSSGAVYFADSANSSVRMIGTNGYISTVAGISGTSGTYSGEGGPATSATMNTTFHLSLDANGNLYVADEGNDMIHVF
jgi:hypothetical protein